MTELNMTDRLFQKGQTWRECLESWSENRDQFLIRVQQAPSAPLVKQTLQTMSGSVRLAVIYHPSQLDSSRTVPLVGAVLADVAETRFFNQTHFFPVFHHLSRRFPQIRLVDAQNQLSNAWGPRPKLVDEGLQRLESQDSRDRFLEEYDESMFASQLDEDLSSWVLEMARLVRI